MKFSGTLRNYRKERGWTLEYLSGLTQLSIAQLSKLETGKSAPSLESLRKLSEAYAVPISSLTRNEVIEPISPVRSGDGFVLRGGTDESIAVRYLTIKRSAKMQPVIIDLPPGKESKGLLSDHTDKFSYILGGDIQFDYGDGLSYSLHAGDFIYFDGSVDHRWKNVGDRTASLLCCADPPLI